MVSEMLELFPLAKSKAHFTFTASVGRAPRPVGASLVTNTIGSVSSARSTEQLPKLRVKIFFVRQSNVDAPAKLLVTDTTSKTHLSLRSLANNES